MKYDLIKFHHWLSISNFKSKWFEENIKLQIISLLSWIIYPDYKVNHNLFSILCKNKLFLSIIGFVFIWSLSMYSFGRLTSLPQKVVLVQKNYFKPDTTFLRFDKLKSERKYIEYVAKSKYKIRNYQNLRKLPDEVFFTLVSEIKRNKLPPSVVFRLIDQESNFLYVTNKFSGAKGYGQILPSTESSILKIIGSTEHEKIDNIRCTSYHLKSRYDFYRKCGFSHKKSLEKSLLDYKGGSSSLIGYSLENYSEELM